MPYPVGRGCFGFIGVEMINVKQKGAGGEREVANALNPIIRRVLAAGGYPAPAVDPVQRNQNQSAVGGNDLTGTFGVGIEVKRQESLSINTWWKQCTEAAARNGEVPVLLFRQNGKKWRCVMPGQLDLPGAQLQARVEVEWDAFLQWFEHWVTRKLANGEQVKV